MKPHKLKIPFKKLPTWQQKFYRLWAKKASIEISDLMDHVLNEEMPKLGGEVNLSFEEKMELDRVMGLRPDPNDIKLTWSEEVTDWFKKKHFTLVRFWRARTRK